MRLKDLMSITLSKFISTELSVGYVIFKRNPLSAINNADFCADRYIFVCPYILERT